jgi:WYL domain
MAVDEQVNKLLRTAIEGKRLLRFEYKGNERIVEPHDYGIQKRTVRLLCWQVGGQSKGLLPGWRLIDVDAIESCEILDRSFAGNREVPSGGHHRWDEVFIRVGPSQKSKQRMSR